MRRAGSVRRRCVQNRNAATEEQTAVRSSNPLHGPCTMPQSRQRTTGLAPTLCRAWIFCRGAPGWQGAHATVLCRCASLEAPWMALKLVLRHSGRPESPWDEDSGHPECPKTMCRSCGAQAACEGGACRTGTWRQRSRQQSGRVAHAPSIQQSAAERYDLQDYQAASGAHLCSTDATVAEYTGPKPVPPSIAEQHVFLTAGVKLE